MLTAVRSGRFVAWGNALLAGLTSPDEAAEHVAADEQHRLAGLPDVPQSMSQPVSLPVAFARLRALGATALRLALPAPGDPLGLPGPVPFNEAATAAGEAVLVGHGLPLGLVPEVVTHGPPGGSRHRVDTLVAVDWAVHRVNPAVVDVPSPAEAERELAESIRRAAAALSALDVAQWRPEAAAALEGICANAGSSGLAPGYPPRARRVLAQAERLAAIVSLAAAGDGSAPSAPVMAARAAELRSLGRAARRAQVAAHDPMLLHPR